MKIVKYCLLRIFFLKKFTFRKYFTNEIDDDEIFEFLIKFEKKNRNIFEIFNEKQIAKRVIQYLRQIISTIDYVVKF